MRRSDQPRRPKAKSCCFLSSLETLAMLTEGTNPHAGVNIPEVIFVGRFWVTAEGDTAAFLPADKNVALEHERRNVLEADGRDMQRQSIFLCQLIHHLRGRKRLDDLAAHPEVSGEIAQEDGKNLAGLNLLAFQAPPPHFSFCLCGGGKAGGGGCCMLYGGFLRRERDKNPPPA